MHVPTNLDTPANPSPQAKIASPPLNNPTPPQPTQIITILIRESASIEDSNTDDGKVWNAALDILESSEGFRALYWGKHVENELEEEGVGRVQLAVGSYLIFLLCLYGARRCFYTIRDLC